jgi:hypothetical protein
MLPRPASKPCSTVQLDDYQSRNTLLFHILISPICRLAHNRLINSDTCRVTFRPNNNVFVVLLIPYCRSERMRTLSCKDVLAVLLLRRGRLMGIGRVLVAWMHPRLEGLFGPSLKSWWFLVRFVLAGPRRVIGVTDLSGKWSWPRSDLSEGGAAHVRHRVGNGKKDNVSICICSNLLN